VKLRSIALLGVVLAACGDQGERPATDEDPQMTEVATSYASELGVDIDAMQRTSSGLYILDVQQGSGDAVQTGNTAVVHYTGYLPDGTEFDSSRDREPFEVNVGAGRVIDGWEEGLVGMQPGGQRRLVIPSHLAYGPRGAGGVIPPNATLVFDIELLEVR